MRDSRDERGAVAIMVAIFTLILCVVAAFVVDFGQAYVNKNRAQEAADAGALAAAKVYMDAAGTCADLASNSALGTAARHEADAVSALDLPGSTPVVSNFVECVDGTLEVHYGVRFNSPLGLGQLAVRTDHVEVNRVATAAFASSPVGNLRPWMVCGAQVPSGPFPSKVVEVHLPGNGHFPPDDRCPDNSPGDWWRVKCFNGGGAHGETEQNVLIGCDSVQIVPGQNPSMTPTTLSNHLRANCSRASVYCLVNDQGRDVRNLAPAWDTLLGKTIAMPVFCTVPDCDPSSVVNGRWPVWKIAAVTVCGYALDGVRSADTLPAGDCRTRNADSLSPSTTFPDQGDLGFLLIFRGLIAAGTPTTFADTKTSLRLIE